MAYRILVGALIVEVDSASEVASLFGVMGLAFAPASSTRMLTTVAGVEHLEEIVIPAARRRAARKAVKARLVNHAHGGGRPTTPAPAGEASVRMGDLEASILRLLRVESFSRSELVRRLKQPTAKIAHALNRLVAASRVHRTGGGPRNSKWNLGAAPGGRPSPAKEAP